MYSVSGDWKTRGVGRVKKKGGESLRFNSHLTSPAFYHTRLFGNTATQLVSRCSRSARQSRVRLRRSTRLSVHSSLILHSSRSRSKPISLHSFRLSTLPSPIPYLIIIDCFHLTFHSHFIHPQFNPGFILITISISLF